MTEFEGSVCEGEECVPDLQSAASHTHTHTETLTCSDVLCLSGCALSVWVCSVCLDVLCVLCLSGCALCALSFWVCSVCVCSLSVCGFFFFPFRVPFLAKVHRKSCCSVLLYLCVFGVFLVFSFCLSCRFLLRRLFFHFSSFLHFPLVCAFEETLVFLLRRTHWYLLLIHKQDAPAVRNDSLIGCCCCGGSER